MASKKNLNVPKKGMNRDSHPSEVGKEEYSFALNANIHDEHGSGRVNLQNEPSNTLCSRFKPDFKVVGYKYDINGDRAYFFLHNPELNISEIGYIIADADAIPLTPTEQGPINDLSVVLETPLEQTDQIESCEYVTLISDYCEITDTATGCLNFSLNFPIYPNNIQIKHENTGITIYFTDGFNPQRYIQVDSLGKYTQDVDDCTGEVTQTCLQCNKLRIFPLHNKPCLQPLVIQNGGNLKAGQYEVLIAGADFEGNALTDYFAMTNPIPIFDRNNLILDQTSLDYTTNQAISIEVLNVDTSFEYFKIVVIYRSGLDGATTNFVNGIYPTSVNKVTIYTGVDKPKIDFTDIINKRVIYTKARGLAEGNSHLFQYGLTQHRRVNLQPVVNLMGSLGRWMTVQAKEDLHENGVFISLYEGYMRDEVYPVGIRFFIDGGYTTALFPLIPRPPTDSEIEALNAPGSTFVSNTNTQSILEYNPNCTEDLRDKRWQFENTATVFPSFCSVPATGNEEITEERLVEETCVISDFEGNVQAVDTIGNSEIEIDIETDLITYINTNLAQIIASTGTNGADIRNVLEDPSQYPQTCTPDFGENCSEDIELVSEEMFAIRVENETKNKVNQEYASYERVEAPATCSNYQYESDGITLVRHSTFETNFMDAGEVVYLRTPNPINSTCGSATQLSTNLASTNQNFLRNQGEIGGIGTLQTSLNASQTSLYQAITLTGTSGTANIVIAAIPYLTTFNVNLTTTASDFVTLHAASILTTHNIVVTNLGDAIIFEGDYSVITIVNLTGDLLGKILFLGYTDKIHSNGVWFKGGFFGQEFAIAEFSATPCNFTDDNSATTVRISVFTNCAATSDLPTYSRIVSNVTTANDISKFIELNSADFGGINGEFYIVVDSPIRTRYISANYRSTLTPSCGCFSAFQREVVTKTLISYVNLEFGKKQTYRSLCAFTIPMLHDCGPIPYQRGLFSYWESVQKYPCNDQLFDSSSLVIPSDILPLEYRAEFESYYVGATAGGNYILNSNANFMDKPIRHYKFPDSSIVPFMSSGPQRPADFQESVIYPIGFFISTDVINAFLDVAVLNGLLTAEERAKVSSYEVFRGDRRVDKSIVAKGLLFDMYNYTESNTDIVHYSNYPLNTLGTDKYNNVPHPYGSAGNHKFTFHSPETHFYKPTLPAEMRIEGYQLGAAASYFDEVADHSTYVLLGKDAYILATTLAFVEAAAELALQSGTWLVDGAAGGVSAFASTAIAITTIAIYTTASLFEAGKYRYGWIEIFRNLGKPYNFAYYQVAIGFYNYFLQNTVANSLLRGLTIDTYLAAGRWAVADESVGGASLNVNNVDREDTVMVSMGLPAFNINYPPQYSTYDNSDISEGASSRLRYTGTGRSPKLVSRAASPYVSLKQYLPAQYGDINSVDWVSTGHCGNLSENIDCNPIFGGDIFISRFSLKRKLPFFTSNTTDSPPLLPFKYSDYFNINANNPSNRYFIDYLLDDDTNNVASFVFPANRSVFSLDGGSSVVTDSNNSGFYVKPPNKFYLFSYGIPHFLVESGINCNFRYAKREKHEQFYPQVGDVIDWTQEKNVSIKEPNTYFYNTVYSQGHTNAAWEVLPINYKKELYDKLNDLNDAVITSKADLSQTSLTNPWLVYKALDFYMFPKNYGGLIDLTGIESEQVLGRFQNGITLFGAVDLLADRLTEGTKNLGTAGIFSGRNINFNTTELGYAGTQHKVMINCEFGHFWVDAKRGKVFQLAPNGKGLEEISKGENDSLEKWFKENLPFKITNFIDDLTALDVDNTFKGLGISMGWDDRLKRVFITKKDYTPKENVCYSAGNFHDTSGYENLISQWEELGYTYAGVDECRLKFTLEVNGILTESFVQTRTVRAGDTRYFDECSWTVAYNPQLKAWISYYSFKPDYYINYNDYFQTGINFSNDENEIGLWSHSPFTSSYQVFYGRLYPFIIEYAIQSLGTFSRLSSIEYWLDVRKYYNKYDYTDVYGIGFDKAMVYNSFQNSGQLNLVFQVLNDMRQHLIYPQYNVDSVNILQTEMNSRWSFNYLFNMIRNERSGLPVRLHNCSQTDFTLDSRLLDYQYNLKDYLRGDFFSVRLQNTLNSRYKMIFRFSSDEREFYQD